VNKQIPEYLKLAADTICEPPPLVSEDLSALNQVSAAFEQTTGWRLEYAAGTPPLATQNLMWSAPVNPGVGVSPGHIRLLSVEQAATEFPAELESAIELAGAIGKLWAELLATRSALWQREAELASGVPLVARDEDNTAASVGQRLEAVLKGGAEAIGCQAAGLFLLDAGTTELKLRSSWGLPRKRLTEPARPLRGALGDLEALLGHAVVLTDSQMHGYWKVPEPGFASCVCVPVSSATMPLGTLWAFCNHPREFSDAQTNILEVVAGRLAADLERQVLVGEAISSRDQTKQVARLARSQQEQLPRRAPMIEGWEIAAKAYHAGPVGGTFYDWFAQAGGGISALAGDAQAHGIQGAMTASALRAAARAFAPERKEPHLLLEAANSVLWTGSTGDSCAGMFHAIVEPASNSLRFAKAGPMRVLAIGADGGRTIGNAAHALGQDESLRLKSTSRRLAARELIMAYGTTFSSDADESILAAFDQRLALSVEPHLKLSARKLIEIAGEILETYPSIESRDRVLLVVKRTLA
jgi:phosphoserine phosphatase RsbU/P